MAQEWQREHAAEEQGRYAAGQTLSPSATLSPKDLLTTAINELGRGKPDFSYLDKIAASCSEKAGKAGNDATIT